MSTRPSARVWRLVTVAAFASAGVMFVTSGLNSHGVDLRVSSVTDLDTVLLHERSQVNAKQDRVGELNREVSGLTKQVHGLRIERIQRKVDRLKGPAGFRPVSGRGMTVTLDDAPKSTIDKAKADGSVSIDALVVHQQDIQAVVNALWLGGAQAITVQNQRITSTTGIKCVGNTVVLHGVPYSPPYEITAVGDPVDLEKAISDSEYVAAYQTFVEQYHLGWSAVVSDQLDLPAYEGSADLRYARRG